jgi:hypothetical protein
MAAMAALAGLAAALPVVARRVELRTAGAALTTFLRGPAVVRGWLVVAPDDAGADFADPPSSAAAIPAPAETIADPMPNATARAPTFPTVGR